AKKGDEAAVRGHHRVERERVTAAGHQRVDAHQGGDVQLTVAHEDVFRAVAVGNALHQVGGGAHEADVAAVGADRGAAGVVVACGGAGDIDADQFGGPRLQVSDEDVRQI